ncbi:MAG TPA: chorismate synthase [Anaerohalosphaeraceae bacterium]|nr:chorismate synthase [Anaerohalosphaeraceae bacterium]HOL32515.1 chorismate synthase [Anaerohalosphaeraceae bacterium]HOM77106.1 chorismate synthase [Anaerohalosphaeraceae bacterium]HPC64323.1 chorismate synthase [Anaerohalosphaeraceae bacterium]HPO69589.1 chorismate synthase [Anaerohalosphaeraceae bacterium]
MFGCHIGRNFQVTVAGGSYQEGLTAVVQGCPPGMILTEQEIYGDLLLRKPGADELSSPRKEPDLPIIYTGLNAADTVEGANNKNHTNGTPLTILIPNLDRHFIHIKQYQDTNRTPRPGHASYASFVKYGPDDDAIGAGIFSGRYTSTIVAAGYVAKKILKAFGIEVFSFIKEMAGVRCSEMDSKAIFSCTERYKKMRHDFDPFYQEIFVKGRITPDMRFLEKTAVLAQVEKEIDDIRSQAPKMAVNEIIERYNVHPIVNCPDIDTANAMVAACNKITKTGDSSGGVVEVRVMGVPTGLGEPVFFKLDAELGRMLGIGAVKGVEVGAGFAVKDMTGSQSNDAMHAENGKVVFDSNNAGGITGGLSTGQDIIVRLAVKPTPTIDKPQHTIDKYTLKNTQLAAITRRDPTIVGRIWPVAENYTAMVILDHLLSHLGYQQMKSHFSR